MAEIASSGSRYLSKMGIIGWDKLEPLIFSALLSYRAIMFSGEKGSGKTEIPKVITESLLGVGGFRYFLAPITGQDELLGYPDINALKHGKVRYLRTPMSIWGASGVLFDEMNRAGPGVQGKMMEVALSGTVMGMETGVKFRFSAVNPPNRYLTTPMDLAALSRFSTFKVPSLRDMAAENKAIIEEMTTAKIKVVNLKREWSALQGTKLDADIIRRLRVIAAAVVGKLVSDDSMTSLRNGEFDFSGRQAVQGVYNQFKGLWRYYKHTGVSWETEEICGYMTQLVMSSIPECTDLVDSTLTVDRTLVESLVLETIKEVYAASTSTTGFEGLAKQLKKGKVNPELMEKLLAQLSAQPDPMAAWSKFKKGIPKSNATRSVDDFVIAQMISGSLYLGDHDAIMQHIKDSRAK